MEITNETQSKQQVLSPGDEIFSFPNIVFLRRMLRTCAQIQSKYIFERTQHMVESDMNARCAIKTLLLVNRSRRCIHTLR